MNKKALAVKYSVGMEAPYVIAKSKGELTRRLLEIAEKHDIPVIKDQNFIKQVFEIPLGIIPEKYYDVFAELLVFMNRIQGKV
jgi:flagellar biosynthesis protein